MPKTVSSPKRSRDQRVPEPEQGLSKAEEERVEESLPLRAAVVYEIIRTEGEGELKRRPLSLWWSGLAAGLSIGFSFVAEALLLAHLPEAQWVPLIAELGYAAGFLIVILGRQQFFTENTLTAILPVMAESKTDLLAPAMRLWVIVLGANLVGAFLFAAVLAAMPPTDLTTELRALAEELAAKSPSAMFMNGIGAGWLIAALVWMLPSAEGSEWVVITFMTYLLSLLGFNHVVVGSVEMFYAVLIGQAGATSFVWPFFVPTLAGNILGGTGLFALLTYAQVRSEIE